jgi:hypothetical protein
MPFVQLSQPSINIAAHIRHLQIRPHMSQLRLPPQTPRANSRA